MIVGNTVPDYAGKEIKGTVKEAAGKVTGNRETQSEGLAEKIVGKIQNHIGKAGDVLKHELKRYPTDPNMWKAKTFAAWCELGAEDRLKVAAAIPGFVAYCRRDPTCRPVHMVRFITERRFDGLLDTVAPRPTTADD